jgi:hypothetical protein
MNRWARVGILAASVVIFGWVGLGHVLGRTANDKAYKSLVVYGEVLQKIQQDYVDEPNMHLVEAGSLHGLLESLDSESSYLTPREYTEYKQKTSSPGTGNWPQPQQALWLHHCYLRSSRQPSRQSRTSQWRYF